MGAVCGYDRQIRVWGFRHHVNNPVVDTILYYRHFDNPIVEAILYGRDQVLEYLVRRGVSAVLGRPSPLNAMLRTGRIEVSKTLSVARGFQSAVDNWKPEARVRGKPAANGLELCDRQGHLFKLMMMRGCPLSVGEFENILRANKDTLRARAIAAVDADCTEYWSCRAVGGKHQFWPRILHFPLVLYSNNEAPRRFLVRWIKDALPHWNGTKPCKCCFQPNGQGDRIMRTREGFWEMVKACLACELIRTFARPPGERYTSDDADYRPYRVTYSGTRTGQTMAETRGWIELVWNSMKKLGMTCSEEETAELKSSFAYEIVEQRRRHYEHGLRCPHQSRMMTTAQYVCILRAAFEQKRDKLVFDKEVNVKKEVGAEKFYDW
ncbi:hypothetical protein RB595_009040 [Gaeumannomyces hyphopodioides]